MANLLVDKRDQLFVLNEMLKVDRLSRFSLFSEHTGYNMVLDEAHMFAEKELVATTESGDREGCSYDPANHSVKLPENYRIPFEKLREGKWFTMCDAPLVGGDGFPLTVGTAVSEVFYAGGFYLYGGVEITHAAAKVIEVFGDQKQKDIYMQRLYDLEWMATMCLTEPDAGSDVGSIMTEATPEADGTYKIEGTKIFITMGDHDLTENIIHVLLARIKGDPPCSKGLSLFIIPKYRVDDQGKIIDRNGVYCTGTEHKMGLNGLVTCTLSFGDKNHCTGYLLGKKGQGIMEMFHMMNEQRLLVGLEGLSFSSCAYLNAVDYTQKRQQGRSVEKPYEKVSIIEHPDVKRMLLTMKAYVEGGRAMTYYSSFCLDHVNGIENDTRIGKKVEDAAPYKKLVDLMIPIVKAYNTEKSWEITGMAMQCAGGYGYCKDYPFERLARDCKVTSIFEGTNGIQSIDLVFRKIIQDDRKAFDLLMDEIGQTVEAGKEDASTKPYALRIENISIMLSEVVDQFIDATNRNDKRSIYTQTVPFLECMGDVILGWMHLWQMTICTKYLSRYDVDLNDDKVFTVIKKKKRAGFYYGKILSARFYINTLLPKTMGKLEGLTSDADPVLKISKRLL